MKKIIESGKILHVIGELAPESRKGEIKFREILDEYLSENQDISVCYYNQPMRNDIIPDFVMITKKNGIFIFEIKDYDDKFIQEVSENDFWFINTQDGYRENPYDQLKKYYRTIRDVVDELHYNDLTENIHQFLIFPFLSKKSKIASEIQKHDRPLVHRLFKEDITPNSNFKKIFDSYWVNKIEFSIEQIKRLHCEIFPDNKVNETEIWKYVPQQYKVLMLDDNQREFAFNLRDGHRILLGCAGCGKTVVLIARARYLAKIHDDWEILVLCFNQQLSKMLKNYIQSNNYPNVTVNTFHSWAKDVISTVLEDKRKYKADKKSFSRNVFYRDIVPASLNKVLMKKIENGKPLLYDAILIDEGQDFPSNWYKLILKTLKNPNEGSLFITYDGMQGIYRKEKGVSWEKLGISARGRRTYKLKKTYRTSKKAGKLAHHVMPTKLKELAKEFEEYSLQEIFIGLEGEVNYHKFNSKYEEYKNLLEIISRERKNLEVKSIMVLFNSNPKDYYYKNDFLQFAENKNLEFRFVYDWTESSRGVVITSIRKAKGLEADVVIVPELCKYEEDDRQLLYVGFTRSKNKLILTTSSSEQMNSLNIWIENYFKIS